MAKILRNSRAEMDQPKKLLNLEKVLFPQILWKKRETFLKDTINSLSLLWSNYISYQLMRGVGNEKILICEIEQTIHVSRVCGVVE